MQHRNLRLGESLHKMVQLQRRLCDYIEEQCEFLTPDPTSAGLLNLLSCEMIFRQTEHEDYSDCSSELTPPPWNTYKPPGADSFVEDAFTQFAIARHSPTSATSDELLR